MSIGTWVGAEWLAAACEADRQKHTQWQHDCCVAQQQVH